MKREEILKLFNDDPQRLVDEEIELNFGKYGKVKLVDGIAAGVPFYGFKFLTGKYVGKTIYCTRDVIFQYGVEPQPAEDRWIYAADIESDGFRFNCEDEDCAGDYIPELDEVIFELKN